MPITITGGEAIAGRVRSELGAFTTALAGTFEEGVAIAGSMNPTLGAFTANFDGQFVASATRDGDLSVTIGGFGASFEGLFFTGTQDTTPPPIPTGLAMSSRTYSSITMSWNASVDVEGGPGEAVSGTKGYRLFRDSVQIADTIELSYNDTSLSLGTSYDYQVRAYDNAGNVSNLSSVVAVSTIDVSWDTIPSTLPVGTTYNVLQHLNDPGSIVTATRAIGLTGDASYDSGTGILTYGTSEQTGITMEADYGVSATLEVPSVQDERDLYTSLGLTIPAGYDSIYPSPDEARFLAGWTSDLSMHNDTEGDDLWMALVQYERYNADGNASQATHWWTRAQSMRDFMVTYECGTTGPPSTGEQDLDHLYGWGLAKWIKDYGPDAAALTALNNTRATVQSNFQYTRLIGSSAGWTWKQGNGGRRWSRWLLFAVAIADVDPTAANIAFRNQIFDWCIINDPNWDETWPGAPANTKAPWKGASYTNAYGEDYDAGARVVALFEIGVLSDALWRCYIDYTAEGDTTRATWARTRMIEVANFFMDFGFEGNGLIRNVFGWNINTGEKLLGATGYGSIQARDNGYEDGIYTICEVNFLVFAYKFTGDTSYLTQAKTIIETVQTYNRTAGQISRFFDTIQDSYTSAGSKLMGNNKGELQYMYQVMENGGSPEVVG